MGIMQGVDGGVQQQGAPATVAADQSLDEGADFLRVVLADTEDTWTPIFQSAGRQYQPTTLRLYSGRDVSGCGAASSAAGPFYCPADQRVYIDLTFFDELIQRFGGPQDAASAGSFAQAYVVAHEVGHHVQNLLGVTERTDQARQRVSKVQGNAISVRVELQADCLAGVWAHHSQQGKGWLEQGDLEEALNAATKIGDDTLQKQAQGYAVPDSFTHGSAEQRMRWFKRGMEAGQLAACNTFQARSL